MEGLAAEDGVPAAGLAQQSRQQRAAAELDRRGGAAGEAVGRVGDGEPVQDGGGDV